MVKEIVEIQCEHGLHARPASALVALVKNSNCKVTLATSQKAVNGSSMIGILSLGLKCGTSVEIQVEGAMEQTVVRDVASILAQKDL